MGTKTFLQGVKDQRILLAISRMIYRNPPGKDFADGYTWQEHAESGDECLSSIQETLEKVGCCHDKSHGDNPPPMMYNDWIRCAIAKREKRIKELEAMLGEAHQEIRYWMEHANTKHSGPAEAGIVESTPTVESSSGRDRESAEAPPSSEPERTDLRGSDRLSGGSGEAETPTGDVPVEGSNSVTEG